MKERQFHWNDPITEFQFIINFVTEDYEMNISEAQAYLALPKFRTEQGKYHSNCLQKSVCVGVILFFRKQFCFYFEVT